MPPRQRCAVTSWKWRRWQRAAGIQGAANGAFVFASLLALAPMVSDAATVQPEDCTRPPYCHQWWLSGHKTLGTVGVFFCVVLGSILAILIVLVLCLTFALMGRSCCTAVGGLCWAPEDYQPVEQHDHGLGSAPRDYQPVEQHDRDIEARRDSPRSRGSSRPWSVLLLACCCGAFLAVPALAGGAFYWWRISCSPALVGLPLLANSTRVARRHGRGGDAGKERRKDKSGSSGRKVN